MVALVKQQSNTHLPIDEVIHGDALLVLHSLSDNSVDAIVSDPPAGINFMGKDFDKDRGGRLQWIAWLSEIMREALRVTKPGGHALIWALPRTSHWTATALEDAGWEIREKCYHLFGSGFPKSKNLGDGVGSALKPAVEEWILCRKPLSESSLEANYRRWGTGGLNIDATRIGTRADAPQYRPASPSGIGHGKNCYGTRDGKEQVYTEGRFPSHLLLSHSLFCTEDSCDHSCPIRILGEQSGIRKSGGGIKSKAGHSIGMLRGEEAYHFRHDGAYCEPSEGGASRYFQTFHYFSKASRAERNQGCEGLPEQANRINAPRDCEEEKFSPSLNHHPTVKSLSLMSWLCRLITPPDGIVLDPFLGSGSTAVAAIHEGFHFIGIEAEAEYVAICEARIAHALKEVS